MALTSLIRKVERNCAQVSTSRKNPRCLRVPRINCAERVLWCRIAEDGTFDIPRKFYRLTVRVLVLRRPVSAAGRSWLLAPTHNHLPRVAHADGERFPGCQVELSGVQRADQRGSAHQAIRKRSCAMRTLGLGCEHLSASSGKHGDSLPEDRKYPALTQRDSAERPSFNSFMFAVTTAPAKPM